MIRRGLIACAVLVACRGGGSKPHVPRDIPQSPAGIDRDVIVREVDAALAIADRACACSDVACIEAVDAEVVEFSRTATLNDPVTDIETYPTDLDALGYSAHLRIYACMISFGYRSKADAVVHLRKAQGFRDAACSCMDAACARRVKSALEKYGKDLEDDQSPIEPDDLETLTQRFGEARRCIDAPIAQQAIHELTAIRDASCRCGDPECVAEQRSAFQAWVEAYKDVGATAQSSIEKATELVSEISGCWSDAEAP